MSKVIILQGVPASGKSTWAREFVRDKKDWVIVSRDSIREGTGMYWCPDREDYISDIERFSVLSACSHGLNVIVDATNLNPNTIRRWKDLMYPFSDVELEFKMFDIPLKEALRRDTLPGRRSVGEKVIRSFYDKYINI